MTEINRRRFLGWIGAAPFLLHSQSGLATSRAFSSTHSRAAMQRFSSASQGLDGQFYLHLFDGFGQELLRHTLPGRAHQVTPHPHKPWLFAVSRRPGTRIDVLDYQTGTWVTQITCADGYHLYGHAQISANGRYLLTTENSSRHEDGRVVIRDITEHFNIVEEYSSAGIGPHELRLSHDKKTLIVANGGIKTEGRKKLNLASMRPSLAYLDMQTGKLVEQVRLPEEYHQSSIRHIDISATGQVLIAMQYEGNPGDTVPLIASHSRGEAISPLTIPSRIHNRLNQYCSSACFDSSGRFAAVSSPRGNLITLWDMHARNFHAAVKVNDGSGLSKTGKAGEFLVSTGAGQLYSIDALASTQAYLLTPQHNNIHWDNHLSYVSSS